MSANYRHSQFNDAKSIRAYLYQIVRNDCIKFYQQTGKVIAMQKEISFLTSVDVKDNIEGDIIRAEFYGELYSAINTLTAEDLGLVLTTGYRR